MDFTILAVVLLIGVGIPVRNKIIRKYREEKKEKKIMTEIQSDGYGKDSFTKDPRVILFYWLVKMRRS